MTAPTVAPGQFETWLLRHYTPPEHPRRGAKTAAVRAFAASYGVGESTVWQWLSGLRDVPAYLARDMAREP